MMRKAGAAMAALGFSALSLQGCGGGSGSTATTVTTTKVATTTTTTTSTVTTTTLGPLGPQPKQDLVPIKGISYRALPFKILDIPPGEDMMQKGYELMYHTGRDDLGMMRAMGASAVRIYAGLGSELYTDHGAFLDRAFDLGLNVIVDFYTSARCPEFDCYATWKNMSVTGLKNQGMMKDGAWHPAIKIIMLMNEPDNLPFNDDQGAQPSCPKDAAEPPQFMPWCRVKAVLSALDGLMAAEEATGIADGSSAMVGVAWSFASRESIDKVCKPTMPNENMFGFQDIMAGIADPDIASYSFRTSGSTEFYKNRWVNAINSPAPWSFTKLKVNDQYAPYAPTKFFISQLTPADDSPQDLNADLIAIDAEAKKGGEFMGVVVKGFQTDYTDPEAFTFMFNLGDKKLGSVHVCQESPGHPENPICGDYDIWCLDPTKGKHSAYVFAAWGGKVKPAMGLCPGLAEEPVEEDATDFIA